MSQTRLRDPHYAPKGAQAFFTCLPSINISSLRDFPIVKNAAKKQETRYLATQLRNHRDAEKRNQTC